MSWLSEHEWKIQFVKIFNMSHCRDNEQEEEEEEEAEDEPQLTIVCPNPW